MPSGPTESTFAATTKTKIDRRLAAYTAAAGAGLVAAGTADAAIQFSGPQSIAIPFGGLVSIDIDGDSNNDIGFTHLPSFTSPANVALFVGDPTSNNMVAATVSGTGFPSLFADQFATSNSVSAGLLFTGSAPMGVYSTGTLVTPGPWQGPTTGYLGFKLAGGELGWMSITINANLTGTINGWAYEDQAGTAIHVADIPEPSAIATLALGAVGVLARRRKKAE